MVDALNDYRALRKVMASNETHFMKKYLKDEKVENDVLKEKLQKLFSDTKNGIEQISLKFLDEVAALQKLEDDESKEKEDTADKTEIEEASVADKKSEQEEEEEETFEEAISSPVKDSVSPRKRSSVSPASSKPSPAKSRDSLSKESPAKRKDSKSSPAKSDKAEKSQTSEDGDSDFVDTETEKVLNDTTMCLAIPDDEAEEDNEQSKNAGSESLLVNVSSSANDSSRNETKNDDHSDEEDAEADESRVLNDTTLNTSADDAIEHNGVEANGTGDHSEENDEEEKQNDKDSSSKKAKVNGKAEDESLYDRFRVLDNDPDDEQLKNEKLAKLAVLQSSSSDNTSSSENEATKLKSSDSDLSGVSVLHSDADDSKTV